MTGASTGSAGWAAFLIFIVTQQIFVPREVAGQQLKGRDYAVELTANIASTPPEIQLSWPGDGYARGYTIRRKGRDDPAWQEIGVARGEATGFLDRNVQRGVGYEYQVIKESALSITGYGYIYAGIELPLVEDRGVVILVATENLASGLSVELLRLELDLIGDGWRVERATVRTNDSPTEVRRLVRSIYDKAPGRTRALLLFGNVPVAYSGDIMPDGHDNHQGAWPADVFYADVDGAWTDDVVESTAGESRRQWNRPGDGKFDQDSPPSAIELQTGRVDLSRLTCFSNKTPSRSELDLARLYLGKNHRFRVGEFPVEQRAIVFDRIESKTAEPVAAMAWRNFAPFVGRNTAQIADLEYFPKVSSGTYLWTAVCAGGSYIASDHVGTSDAFALYAVNAPFTTFLGSYYGDWDVESSFLRAALGAPGLLLSTVYAGQPQWMFHHMALGETIGFAARITQENGTNGLYAPHNSGAGQVHVALLGDPTLRAHPVPAVRDLVVESDGSGLVAKWQVPVIEGFVGFHVYKSPDPKGPYQRLTEQPLPQAEFRLPIGSAGDTFMVKAVALTRTPSGSYFNSSVGVFSPDPLESALSTPPEAPSGMSVARVTAQGITLAWVGASAKAVGFRLERKDPGASDFREIASTAHDQFTFEDRGPGEGRVQGSYVYRVRAFNQFGISPYSNEAVASTLAGAADFVAFDTFTQGNWIRTYGREGFAIPGLHDELPPSLSLITSNVVLYKTGLQEDVRGVQLTNSELRSANCWVNGWPMAFHFNFSDEKVHQVAFYLAAWERRNPWAEFEVFDAVTGTSLDRRRLEGFDEGAYVIYNVKRQVYVRVTPPSVYTNAEIYGLFIDPVQVAPVEMEPPGGTFSGGTAVRLKSATARSEIFYTLDGSEPTSQSTRYTGPISLTASARIRARAFREGFEPSVAVEAHFQNNLPNLVAMIGTDDQTRGDWVGRFGSEGSWWPMGQQTLGEGLEAGLENATPWSWSEGTTDVRALLAGADGDLRQARVWYAPEALHLRVSVLDTRMHAVSLYFVDFDRSSRAQVIEFAAGAVRETFRLEGFSGGRYVTMGVQGICDIRIRRLHGPNAVLSGVFIDPAPPGLSPGKPAPLTDLRVAEGRLIFALAGPPGWRVCLDRSQDCTHWTCSSTNELTSANTELSTVIDVFESSQFFRTHFLP